MRAEFCVNCLATSCRSLLSASALTALLALCGCTLMPFGKEHSEALLNQVTRQDSEPRLSPPPELVREPSPYPTAVNAAKVPTPLPLQQPGTPVARPLDPQQLAGRLPIRFEGQPPASSQSQNPPPAATPTATQSGAPPITLEVSPAGALAPTLMTPEKLWPVNTPLGSLNTLPAEPASAKPVAHATPVIETPAPQPITPPAIVFPQFIPPNTAALSVPPAPTSTPEPPSASGTAASEKESAETLMPKLIELLQQEIRDRTERKELEEIPALQQKLRLMQLVVGDTDDAVDQIEHLPTAEREAFKQLMFALTTWLSPDDAKRASLRNAKILRALHEANNRLSAASKLDLKNLMFCEKVESFGWYTEFPRAEFLPKQQVILYVEVQNFAAEEKSASSFETELQGSYQIFDTAGNLVAEHQLPLDREVCRNYRRDYFLAYRLYLPGDIAPGRYRLELTVEDLKAKQDFKGRKQGEALIEFTIK